MSFLSRITGWLHQTTTSTDRLAARQLRQLARRFGATDIVDLQTGHLSKVFGQVQSVTVDPSGSVARFQATIADGSGQLHCIWLGRRRIRGIIPDALITVVGRPAKLGAGLAIYDPAYQLLPAGAEDQAIDATS